MLEMGEVPSPALVISAIPAAQIGTPAKNMEYRRTPSFPVILPPPNLSVCMPHAPPSERSFTPRPPQRPCDRPFPGAVCHAGAALRRTAEVCLLFPQEIAVVVLHCQD